MTPDELARQQARANYLRQQQSQADILRKSAMTPEALAEAIRLSGYDPQGKEQMLATMLRGGQDALFSDLPRGKRVGDIYVAPTWSESLNNAVQKGLGGYQMGQARKEQTSIDDQRAAASAAEAQVAAEQARAKQLADAEKAIMSTMDSQSDDDRAERQMAQAAELAGLARAAADARAAKTAGASDKRTVVSFTDPSDPTKPLNLKRDSAGNFTTMADVPVAPEVAASLPPWKAPKADAGSYELKTQKEREQFQGGGEKLRATMAISDDFKDEYTTPEILRSPATAGLENLAQGTLGIGTPGQSSYWSGVAKAELVPRHELFGSAFTAPEQKAYDATTITPGLRAKEIRARLAKRVELETLHTERMVAGSLLKGMNPKEVELYYGDVIDVPGIKAKIDAGTYDFSYKDRVGGKDKGGSAKDAPKKTVNDYTEEEFMRLSDEERAAVLGG